MPNYAVGKAGQLIEKQDQVFSYNKMPADEARASRNKRARELRAEGYTVTVYSYSEFCGLEWWKEDDND